MLLEKVDVGLDCVDGRGQKVGLETTGAKMGQKTTDADILPPDEMGNAHNP